MRRPEVFGIRFAQHCVARSSSAQTLHNADPRIEAFVFSREGKLALINKTDAPFSCTVPEGVRAKPILRLSAPSIDAKQDVKLAPVHARHAATAAAPAYTATVFELRRNLPQTQRANHR